MRVTTWRSVAFATMLVLGLGACSDDSDEESQGSSEPSAATTAAPDAPELTGEPVRLGFINQEEGSGNTFPDAREGAEAAVELVNEEGGIGGRPLELVTCLTDGSPAASQTCANEMIESGVVAVQAGLDFGGPAAVPVITAAGVPYVPSVPIQAPDYRTDGVFTFFGGSAGQFRAQTGFIVDEFQPERVGVLVINVPAGTSAAEGLVKAPLEAEGVTVNVLPVDPNTSDFTSSLTALMQEDPDVIMVLFTGTPCGQIMQGVASLGIDVPTLYPSGCSDPQYVEAGGAGAEGAIFSIETLLPTLHSDDPDIVLFLDAMDRFAGEGPEEISSYDQAGFATTYNLAQLLSGIAGDLTPEAVLEALRGTVDQPNLMSSPYTCDGTAVPGFPTICNAAVRIVQREGDSFTELTDDWLV